MAFRLGSIPVRIHPSFLMMTAILGFSGGADFMSIIVWVLVVLPSVLAHELGHALMGRAFGLAPQIDLHGMGGTTSWRNGREKIGTVRSIAISLAGPSVGILVGVFTLILTTTGRLPDTPTAERIADTVIFVNAGWGVLNLLPILPLDGGNVMASLLNAFTKGKGERPARYVSIVVAVLAAGAALYGKWYFALMLAALFAYRNFDALRRSTRINADAPYIGAIRDAHAALERRDGLTAIARAEPVLSLATSPELRYEAIRVLAHARLLEGQWMPLMALLERSGKELGKEELARLAKATEELGRPEEAARIRAIDQAPVADGFRA